MCLALLQAEQSVQTVSYIAQHKVSKWRRIFINFPDTDSDNMQAVAGQAAKMVAVQQYTGRYGSSMEAAAAIERSCYR